jgi:hypothetical protein
MIITIAIIAMTDTEAATHSPPLSPHGRGAGGEGGESLTYPSLPAYASPSIYCHTFRDLDFFVVRRIPCSGCSLESPHGQRTRDTTYNEPRALPVTSGRRASAWAHRSHTIPRTRATQSTNMSSK